MPGLEINREAVKNGELFDKYQCPHCRQLLRDAVQPQCGHWLCESCADELLTDCCSKCPKQDCQERLNSDGEEPEYFPDRFVRKEIMKMTVSCPHKQRGCQWEGKLGGLDNHLKECQHISEELRCPFAGLGCEHTQTMTGEELKQHIADHGVEHLQSIATIVKLLQSQWKGSACVASHTELPHLVVERDGAHPKIASKGVRQNKTSFEALLDQLTCGDGSGQEKMISELAMVTEKLKSKFTSELRRKDEEISELRSTVTKLEKSIRSKHAEYEDRDFRLSLIENSNFDGNMIWKIPQFSQRMADAQSGRYTSIFSLPFYTGRYSYKMCLRLYILGDGIGKKSHMSLFFVIMKGEFDNILQWPFTHKVTFKLINQTGGRDIIDTFQPDPMSSSFRKPKSDMNIASGCPRLVSHTELKNGGFILDDTLFIKCTVDTSSVQHP